jgi:hypothetical protein
VVAPKAHQRGRTPRCDRTTRHRTTFRSPRQAPSARNNIRPQTIGAGRIITPWIRSRAECDPCSSGHFDSATWQSTLLSEAADLHGIAGTGPEKVRNLQMLMLRSRSNVLLSVRRGHRAQHWPQDGRGRRRGRPYPAGRSARTNHRWRRRPQPASPANTHQRRSGVGVKALRRGTIGS